MDNLVEIGGRRSGDRAASSFSATCRRLSQYLKEKGSFGELSLGMVASPFRVEGKPEMLRTLNLLPRVEASSGGSDDEPPADRDAVPDHPVELLPRCTVMPDFNREQKNAPITIFYGGKLVVFNNFTADKAKELLDMAGKACQHPAQKSPVEQPAPATVAPAQHHPAPAGATAAPVSKTTPAAAAGAVAATAVDSAATPAVAKQEAAPSNTPQPAASDLPIARRVSLNRFLEKRKDRITAKAPYQVNASSGAPGSSSSPPAKGEENGREWLGLGPQGASKAEVDSAGGWRALPKLPANSGSDRG
ncbi:hypothetical protein Taro_043814 [Colocasia esculenta]|uniref:Protein TIFY n=1 Tax=Colocasia esculenta TaxID=4460 RepID=A0A843WT05_COLES|nr:hypothetical protein [Colocasia esculenta]